VREVKRIAGAGLGIIFSGSPRTLYEAKGLLPILRRLYGLKRIFILTLEIPERISLTRNSSRLICRACGTPLLTAYYPKTKLPPQHCPLCGGPFYRRTLDVPKVIKVRLMEYRERTKPVLEFAKKKGFRIKRINAKPAPYLVFRQIYGYLKNVK